MVDVKIKKYLEDRGLFKVNTNYPGVSVYTLESEQSVCVLWILERDAVMTLSSERYMQLEGKIRGAFLSTKKSVNMLSLFLTKDVEKAKELGGEGAYWIVDESYGRVIVYENQPEDFLGMRRDIEGMVSMLKADELQQEAKKATEQMRTEGAYVQPGPEYTYSTHKAPKAKRGSDFKLRGKKFLIDYPVVTIGLIVINVLVLLVINLFGELLGISEYMSKGAVSWMDAYEGKEYYRFITAMFLHADIGHISGNMIVLYAAGEILEDYIGHIRFFFVYLLGGILGGIGSVFYHYRIKEYVESIGASGAVFAVVGGLFMFLFLHRGQTRGIGAQRVLIFAVYTLYSGFANEGTDNAAHVAGLLGGGLIYLIIYTFFDIKNNRSGNNRSNYY